jgi:hypothetical protein
VVAVLLALPLLRSGLAVACSPYSGRHVSCGGTAATAADDPTPALLRGFRRGSVRTVL